MKDALIIPASSQRLGRGFFARHAQDVAKDLLGRVLVIERADACTIYTRLEEIAAYEKETQSMSKGALYSPGTLAISTKFGKNIIDIATLAQGKHSCVTLRGGTVYDQRGIRDVVQGPGNLSQALGITADYDALPLDMLHVWIGGDSVLPSRIRQRNISNTPENFQGSFYVK